MTARSCTFLTLAALLICGAAGTARAQGYGGVYAPFYGFNAGTGPYNLYDNERVIPHFALYPPVYYSAPVARSYGYSPFAYPPGMMTPEVATPETENGVIVPSSSRVMGGSRRTPLVIQNPFCRSELATQSEPGPRPADMSPPRPDDHNEVQLDSP